MGPDGRDGLEWDSLSCMYVYIYMYIYVCVCMHGMELIQFIPSSNQIKSETETERRMVMACL